MNLVYFSVVAALLALLYFAASRQNELFCVSIRDGRALPIRGRIPPGLLSDLTEICPASGSFLLRAVRQDGHPRLVIQGPADERTAQRLRNAFGVYPPIKLKTAPRIPRPNLGQSLGVVALAWHFENTKKSGPSSAD